MKISIGDWVEYSYYDGFSRRYDTAKHCARVIAINSDTGHYTVRRADGTTESVFRIEIVGRCQPDG